MVFQPFSLLDLSANFIKTSNIKYEYNSLPLDLVEYLCRPWYVHNSKRYILYHMGKYGIFKSGIDFVIGKTNNLTPYLNKVNITLDTW